MATGERDDPFRASTSASRSTASTVGASARCSGLTAEGDAVDYREGTDMPLTVRKLLGLRKYANITLKRGYTQNDDAVGLVHATSSTASPTGATAPSC